MVERNKVHYARIVFILNTRVTCGAVCFYHLTEKLIYINNQLFFIINCHFFQSIVLIPNLPCRQTMAAWIWTAQWFWMPLDIMLNEKLFDMVHFVIVYPLHDDVIIWSISALLAVCAGNSPVTAEFPTQMPVTRRFDVFIDLPWISGCANNREAGDLSRHRAHYAVIVMTREILSLFSRLVMIVTITFTHTCRNAVTTGAISRIWCCCSCWG